MNNMSRYIIILSVAISSFPGCTQPEPMVVTQVAIERVVGMPNQPTPYKMLAWKEKAINFDRYVFDRGATGDYMPLIWIDSAQRNIAQNTFGLFTVIGDIRQGPDNNGGEFHEALASLGALMSAGLVGLDKTNQDGYNYVKMVQNYFNSDNGWNIIMNNTNPEVAMLGGGYGRDWWYDVFPNVLYYAVCELYPNVDGADLIQRTIAEQFYRADSVLAGNYDYSYFDYAAMEGKRNQIPYQQDAAAGHAYVLYAAYRKFGDVKYLHGAKSSLEALLSQKESRFYEVLMPFGALTAARMNAEQGTEYDIGKILDWTFDGCTAEDGRTGWGILSDRWGDYDIHGLQGSLTHEGGYGFLMNTFDMAWPLVPMVKYNPKYARTIGKWMLNTANATRLFYPYEIPDENQWLPELKAITKNVIGYEGVKKIDAYDKESLQGVSPVALGDGPNWVVSQPEESMFSIYGSAHVGIFGAIIEETNVEQILKLNCQATDFYGEKNYPVYLYYNPYESGREIIYHNNSEENVDLYDILSGSIVSYNTEKEGHFTIPADEAMLIVVLPANSEIEYKDGRAIVNQKTAFYL
jgi:hypothetical protein